ncbi:MAG: hypothetical protein NZ960_06255 [Candidatus Kapabacteria bacterium]|nr:hypothetical protein [Candidatus Kapabacteria bacterium]
MLDSPDARTSLAASDVAGVALLGIKALAEQVERSGAVVQSTQEDIEALRRENAVLREKTAMLEQRNQVLEQKNQALEQKSRELEQRSQVLEQKSQALERENRLLEQRVAALERLVQELIGRTAAVQGPRLRGNMPEQHERTAILHRAPAITSVGLQVHDMQDGSFRR